MLSKLLGGSLVETVGKVIDSVHVSDEERGKIKIRLQELENEINAKQIEVNIADAQSTATDISGILQRSWRPLIGFSAAISIFWEFVLKNFIMFFLAVFEVQTQPLPSMDMEQLMPLVMALLGMAGLRTFEKSKKITTRRI
jgi:hypothetical protein